MTRETVTRLWIARREETQRRCTHGSSQSPQRRRWRTPKRLSSSCPRTFSLQGRTRARRPIRGAAVPNISTSSKLQVRSLLHVITYIPHFVSLLFSIIPSCYCSPAGSQPGATAGILMAVIILLILILGIVFYVKKRRSRESEWADEYNTNSPSPTGDQTTFGAILGVGLFVAVMLIVIGAVYVTREGTFSCNKGNYTRGQPSSGPVWMRITFFLIVFIRICMALRWKLLFLNVRELI